MVNKAFAIFLPLLISACATQKDWKTVDGSQLEGRQLVAAMESCQYQEAIKSAHHDTMQRAKSIEVRSQQPGESKQDYVEYVKDKEQYHLETQTNNKTKSAQNVKQAYVCMNNKGFVKA